MRYEVELSNVAEDHYDRFHRLAARYIVRGLDRNPSVINFYAIQKALDETLPVNPTDPDRSLAGNLSFLHILPLGSISITYVVVRILKPVVIVQTISRTAKDDSIRRWLTAGIESGELSPVLETLGIQPYLMKMRERFSSTSLVPLSAKASRHNFSKSASVPIFS